MTSMLKGVTSGHPSYSACPVWAATWLLSAGLMSVLWGCPIPPQLVTVCCALLGHQAEHGDGDEGGSAHEWAHNGWIKRMRKKRHHGVEILNLDCESQLHQEALPACKNLALDQIQAQPWSQRTKRYMRGLGLKAQEKLRAPSCLTLRNPVDYSLPGSSVHGISQVRILEWVAISCSKGSSRPKDWTHVSWASCIGRQILYH